MNIWKNLKHPLIICGLIASVAAPSISDAFAEDVPIEVVLNADAFEPVEIKVPAGAPFVLKFLNKSDAAAEIEAKDLKIEKVVEAGGEIIVNVKAMDAGKYLFVNEYKEDTVKGFIVVE